MKVPAVEGGVRELHGHSELLGAEDLQWQVWGGSERDIFPRDAMRALQHVGGLVAGALSGGQVVGLVVGLPTSRPDVQHSHLLAVHPAQRGTGLALALKRFQAQWCAARQITQIEWTYDPLRALNAHFNLHRLGAVVGSYLPDFYGEMGGINAGLPSDRVVAVWTPQHPQPVPRPAQAADLPAVNLSQDGTPHLAYPWPNAVRLHIPPDLDTLLHHDPPAAQQWRHHTRALFQEGLRQGYRATDFVRGKALEEQAPAYVLTRP
ncbi:GNAT family N-acetyltransferase [Deinococcus sp. QL22]|uniref:GNAT family N-acetyltransferase n=1 Tax=Deinococcus sp. QL22 TaxID=2939437 RepID=UPI00201791E3|nr:GNAT family N-acetyltransferase [Deinococcus sp. QL22]UQN08285.1 GNAT family N-acetyltransferase [Deinococcus sp. QL22]